MRKAFVETLVEIAERDDRVVLLTADLGFMVLEPFIRKFPERFFNVAVAEQNMIGVATGLAEAGFIPYCYSISCFSVLRPYEFIRNGPVRHHLPVRMVGVGGGMDYSTNGLTHYGLDDIGILRTLPGITLIVPADSPQARVALRETAALAGPIYYRLSKNDALLVDGLSSAFTIGLPCHQSGRSTLIACMGEIAPRAKEICDLVNRKVPGNYGLGIFSTIQPWDRAGITKILSQYSRVISLEVHFKNNALGSALAETIAEAGLSCRLTRMAVSEISDGKIGSYDYMMSINGLSTEQIVSELLE